MTNPNQLCYVLLFVCSKMTDETNLSSKLPVADVTDKYIYHFYSLAVEAGFMATLSRVILRS